MSVQETNLVSTRRSSASTTSRACWPTRCRHRGPEHRLVRAAGAGLRLPDPARARRAHERGPPRQGPLQRAGLPAGRRPAGRRGAAVEVLLRRQPDGRVQHDPRLGRASGRSRGSRTRRPRCRRSCSRRPGRRAGGTVIIYLAALLSVPPELYDAAEVDGASIWQKIWHVTLPQLRGVLFVTLILQLIATAQLFTRAVPVHRRRTGQLDAHRAAAHLPVRVPEQPGRRLRDGDGAEPDARRLPGRVHRAVLLADPLVEHLTS